MPVEGAVSPGPSATQHKIYLRTRYVDAYSLSTRHCICRDLLAALQPYAVNKKLIPPYWPVNPSSFAGKR